MFGLAVLDSNPGSPVYKAHNLTIWHCFDSDIHFIQTYGNDNNSHKSIMKVSLKSLLVKVKLYLLSVFLFSL